MMTYDKLSSFYWRYSEILLWLFRVMLKFRKIYQPAGIAFPVGEKPNFLTHLNFFLKQWIKNAVTIECSDFLQHIFVSLIILVWYLILDILQQVYTQSWTKLPYSLPDFIHCGSPIELNCPMKIVLVLTEIGFGAPN